jgi:pimeloyl-ACP methyl ester carboxylesterase
MRALASGGVTAILVDMPFNLAVFNPMRADGIKELYPDIQNWYMAGHSLGGSMASSYISTHTAEFKGLILLASYSITDLRDSGISVLSIYGSNDGVMNRDSYEDNKVNLPHGFTERVIEGGNHAYFGMYGEQAGDGVASVSNTEQINTSANLIIDFIK